MSKYDVDFDFKESQPKALGRRNISKKFFVLCMGITFLIFLILSTTNVIQFIKSSKLAESLFKKSSELSKAVSEIQGLKKSINALKDKNSRLTNLNKRYSDEIQLLKGKKDIKKQIRGDDCQDLIITNPISTESFYGDEVIEVSGTHSLSLLEGSDVWIMMDDIYDKYFLQAEPAILLEYGTWNAKVRLVDDIKAIYAVLVESQYKKDFLFAISDRKTHEKFGLIRLIGPPPPYIRILDTVTVKRRKK